MIKTITVRFWIGALVVWGLSGPEALAQDPSTLAAEIREAIVAGIEESIVRLEAGQQEEVETETGATPSDLPGGVTPEAGPQPGPEAAPAPRRDRSIVRFGVDHTVEVDQSVEELAVFGGTVTIHGEVLRDLAVIGGALVISETGRVGGDFVVIGGNVTIFPGASVDGDMVVVGGAIDSPAGFVPGGDEVLAGNILGGANFLAAAVPWVSRGLFWGRLIVPDLSWIWSVVGVLLALYLGLNVLFDGPVTACVQTLGRKPLTTFLVGLLVLLLLGPTSFILMVSVVGLAIVPFLWAALALAGLMGSVAVSRWIGETVLRPDVTADRLRAAGALLVGFSIIVVAFMVPIVGFIAAASLGVLAVGTSSISVLDGLRRENPNATRPPAPPSTGAADSDEPQGGSPPEAAPSTESEPAPSRTPAKDAETLAKDLTVFPRATFLIRAGAFALDAILVMLINGLLVFTNGGGFFLLLLAYHIAFWSWKGTTVGGVICHLRVVRTDGLPLRFTDAFVRGLSSIFSAVVLGLGWFWILNDAERQSWHDKIAGTYVVCVPRNLPLP